MHITQDAPVVSKRASRRTSRIRQRLKTLRTRARYGHRELQRISRTATLGGLFLSFLKVGLVGFGGGLAVIAQIRILTVRIRGWLTEQEFAEGFALAQSLPGTNAGNLVAYIGLKLRGWRGAAVAITGFILPSMLMMIGLAILYKHFSQVSNLRRLFTGLTSAVVALIVVTAWRVGRNTLRKQWQWVVAVLACLAVVVIEATVIEVILAAGLVGILIDSFAEKQIRKWKQTRNATGRRRERIAARVGARRRGMAAPGRPEGAVFVGGYLTRALAEERVRKARLLELENEESHDETAPDPGTQLRSIAGFALAMPIMAKLGILLVLSSAFLRMGAITFGGGFVMIPLIESEVVNARHWLTHQEFADATALGQITPGPVLITATFVGYRVAGTLGALVATVSVFLPSFLMTIAAGSSLKRFRSNEAVQSFLMGVTPAVVGLLVAAALSMGRAGIHSRIGLTLTAVCIFVLIRFKPNAFWLILGAGLARFVIGLVLW